MYYDVPDDRQVMTGIKGLRFHDLRHTFSIRSRRIGMPLEILQRIPGYQGITTTMRYTAIGEGEVDQAINLMCQAGEVAHRQDTQKRNVAGK